MLISIGVDALGMVLKGLEKRLGELKIRERMKTIQTTALLEISCTICNWIIILRWLYS